MASTKRDVVITGVGVVSPIGVGRNDFWQSLCDGQTGIAPVQIAEFGRQHPMVGELRDFDAKQYVKPRKVMKLMCREVTVAFAAAELAIADAQLDTNAVDSERFGVVFGSEMFYGHPAELAEVHRHSIVDGHFDIRAFGAHLEAEMFPLWMLKFLPNMSACHIGIAHQALGANNTIVQGSASGLLALAEATAVIQRGWCDVMITGAGGTSMNPLRVIYQSDDLFSKQAASAPAQPRPFDVQRDGMVRGEGGCAFILEEREHALARGAQPLCQVSGVGMSVGQLAAGQYVGAAQDAIERSIDWALSAADCRAADIGHVNAEGLSTIDADPREARAIQSRLGDCPVLAPKSYFGYLSAGSGAVEMAASALALHEGRVPATLNYSSPDPECPVQVIRDECLEEQHDAALVLSQSTTGQAVAAVLKRS